MNRDRHRQTALGHNVVTTMNPIEPPARGFQLCNDFLARHMVDDRSKTIYPQIQITDARPAFSRLR